MLWVKESKPDTFKTKNFPNLYQHNEKANSRVEDIRNHKIKKMEDLEYVNSVKKSRVKEKTNISLKKAYLGPMHIWKYVWVD